MTETLTQIYDQQVAAGQLTPDAAQRALLPELEARRDWLGEATARRGLLSGLMGRSRPAPKGLYLWGGVGRGKSMLMDLFFGAVPIREKRRVHFHAFMQEVHTRMTAARKRGDADILRPVAADLAMGLRLLRSMRCK